VLRSGHDDDIAAVVDLARAEEAAWFGTPEFSPDELLEVLDWHGGLAEGVVYDDGAIRGAALISAGKHTLVLADPADPEPPYDALVQWIVNRGGTWISTYAGNERFVAWFETHGWTHVHSSFDMSRPGADAVAVAVWPDGIEVRLYDEANDDAVVHRLVYVDAAWTDVPGHTARSLDAWKVFISGPTNRGLVARRDGRPVGWVVGRIFADGRAWVLQVAVAQDERGRGLGRALLLHAYTDFLARGATSLGLDVQATNENALGLYRSIGLEIDKEWKVFELSS